MSYLTQECYKIIFISQRNILPLHCGMKIETNADFEYKANSIVKYLSIKEFQEKIY